MARRKVEDIIEEICKPITDRLELELIDVEYKKEGNGFVLRIVIDNPDGITIENCENVSRELDLKLDEIDPIANGYSLEVQSPGERSLKKEREFLYFQGRDVEAKLYEPYEGKKIFEGKLGILKDNMLSLTIESGDMIQLPMDKIANVKLRINL